MKYAWLKSVRRAAAGTLIALAGIAAISSAQDAPRTVLSAQIRGSINPASASYLRSSIESAEKQGAEAIPRRRCHQ